MDHRLGWRFTACTIHFFACLLLVTTPEIYKHHQHARFEDIWIDSECFCKCLFGAFVIFRTTKTLEPTIHVTGAKPVVGQRKIWVELNGALEMRDRFVTIVRRQRSEYETCKQVATTQVLLVRCRVSRRGFANSNLLCRTEIDA